MVSRCMKKISQPLAFFCYDVQVKFSNRAVNLRSEPDGKTHRAIVGRPNVGKSTIFNRIIGDRLAIVEDKPGVTRDRLYGTAEWLDKPFSVIDTGGIEIEGEDEIMKSVKAQAELAIEESDVIVFMVDAKAGVTPADSEIAQLLFRANKPVILAVNKVDNLKRQDEIYEFYSLGFGDPIGISGAHGLGIGELLDEIVEHFPETDDVDYGEDVIKVALIGRPNVGKSSLVNAILGEERVIVSNIAGTTRDAIDTPFEKRRPKNTSLSIPPACANAARFMKRPRNTA